MKLIPGKSELAGAMRYARSRWQALTRYADDGRLEISNNAAENAIRPVALGRKNWLFAGSDSGGERAAIFYTLIRSAKLNGLEPEAYLRDILARIGEHPINRIRLDHLHAVLQAAMGWTNSHLFEFRVGETGWGIPDKEWGDGPRDASKITLIEVLEDTGTRSLTYLYDFGDGWEHTVRVERPVPAVPGTLYPRLVEATGRCPPEDIGGPPGYEEFLEAIADPNHERHAELTEWHDAGFDPKAVNTAAIEKRLAALAKKITGKPAKPKSKTKKP